MKVNVFSTITTGLVTALGTAFASGVIPTKYAGYAMIAATFLQAFQGKATTSDIVIPAAKVEQLPSTHQAIVEAADQK